MKNSIPPTKNSPITTPIIEKKSKEIYSTRNRDDNNNNSIIRVSPNNQTKRVPISAVTTPFPRITIPIDEESNIPSKTVTTQGRATMTLIYK